MSAEIEQKLNNIVGTIRRMDAGGYSRHYFCERLRANIIKTY